ncbi:MAG: hypothetical protein ACO3A4_14775 [Silvanigrellaceae bacterium]
MEIAVEIVVMVRRSTVSFRDFIKRGVDPIIKLPRIRPQASLSDWSNGRRAC